MSRLYQALKSAEQFAEITVQNALWQNEYGQAFSQAMNDDFNTAKAVSVLFGLAGEINKAVRDDNKEKVLYFACSLKTLAHSLNIAQLPPQKFLQANVNDNGLSELQILQKIAERKQAKTDKNFALADSIRQELKALGIELEDSRTGTTWRRV